MTTRRDESRKTWMDLLRGLAVLLIVAYHASVLPGSYGLSVPAVVNEVNVALSPFRIPTLLVLSGLLLPRSLARRPGRYFTGKLRAILWPYVVWLVVDSLVRGDLTVLADPELWMDGSYLWYLNTLLAGYVIAWVARRVPALVMTVALLLIAVVVEAQSGPLIRILWYGAYFFFGSWLADRLGAWQRAGPIIPAGLGVVAVAWGVVVAAQSTYAPKGLLAFPLSLAGVLVLLWLAPRTPRPRWVRALEYLGRNSIVVYTVHMPAILVAWIGLKSLGVTAVWVVMLGLFSAGVVASVVLIHWRQCFFWLFEFPSRSFRSNGEPSISREGIR